MPLRVRISEPELLPALAESFLRSHCVAQRVSDDTLVVVHVKARDAREAWNEVAFFLRAWQARYPNVTIAQTQ
jgi:hypothetical protein